LSFFHSYNLPLPFSAIIPVECPFLAVTLTVAVTPSLPPPPILLDEAKSGAFFLLSVPPSFSVSPARVLHCLPSLFLPPVFFFFFFFFFWARVRAVTFYALSFFLFTGRSHCLSLTAGFFAFDDERSSFFNIFHFESSPYVVPASPSGEFIFLSPFMDYRQRESGELSFFCCWTISFSPPAMAPCF